MKPTDLSRRHFIELLAKGCTAGAIGSIGQLALMKEAAASSPPSFSDYKALVCVFLYGGNDSFNMLIPTGTGYGEYQEIRAELAVQDNALDLSSISEDIYNGSVGAGPENLYYSNNSQEDAYIKGHYDLASKNIGLGVNAVMPEFAQLIMDNRISLIANCGNLVEPVTREGIQNSTAQLPLYLFSHNHQQRLLQTGRADKLLDSGWAGRIADAWVGINNNSSLGLNISYSGSDYMLSGRNTQPLVLKPGDPPEYYQMRANFNDNHSGHRNLYRDILNIAEQGNVFQALSARLLNRAITNFDYLDSVWKQHSIVYSKTGPYGEQLFDVPDREMLGFSSSLNASSFFSRLETIAKMIDLGAQDAFNTGDYKRQIFFVGLGGFDTHAAQARNHSALLRQLSLGLWKFQTALEELGHANKVLTFSLSDFGRTLSINASQGTDHAWGSHHFVMGGSGTSAPGELNGGQLIGSLPRLLTDGPDDFKDKGRIIPKIAQSQVNAALCKWFGVDHGLISTIFPNLSNFETTPGQTESAYLNDLFV